MICVKQEKFLRTVSLFFCISVEKYRKNVVSGKYSIKLFYVTKRLFRIFFSWRVKRRKHIVKAKDIYMKKFIWSLLIEKSLYTQRNINTVPVYITNAGSFWQISS